MARRESRQHTERGDNKMKELYIIGAGGFAAELTEYIHQNNSIQKEQITILGYFDLDVKQYEAYSYDAPFLGNEREYKFSSEDKVLIAIGDVNIRTKAIEYFESMNIEIENFSHYTALIAATAKIGKGNIFCPYTIIGPNTIVGNFNLLNYYCAIPHDCKIGDFNVFSPNIQITGYCEVGNKNLFGVSSGMKPNISIKNNNKIQPGLIVDKNVKNNSLIFKVEKIKIMELYK